MLTRLFWSKNRPNSSYPRGCLKFFYLLGLRFVIKDMDPWIHGSAAGAAARAAAGAAAGAAASAATVCTYHVDIGRCKAPPL